jgi:hypothetical protein
MLRQRLKLECLVEPLIVQLVCCGKGMSEALGSIPSKRLWLPPPTQVLNEHRLYIITTWHS